MLTVNVVKGKIEAHTPLEYDSLKMTCILWQKLHGPYIFITA
jgi:hypothetical protein